MEMQEFGCGQPIVKPKIFRQEADVPADLDVAHRSAEHEGPADGGPHEAEQHLDRRALPGAVWSQEAEDLTPGDGQREVPDGYVGSNTFRKPSVSIAYWLDTGSAVSLGSVGPVRQRNGITGAAIAGEREHETVLRPH